MAPPSTTTAIRTPPSTGYPRTRVHPRLRSVTAPARRGLLLSDCACSPMRVSGTVPLPPRGDDDTDNCRRDSERSERQWREETDRERRDERSDREHCGEDKPGSRVSHPHTLSAQAGSDLMGTRRSVIVTGNLRLVGAGRAVGPDLAPVSRPCLLCRSEGGDASIGRGGEGGSGLFAVIDSHPAASMPQRSR